MHVVQSQAVELKVSFFQCLHTEFKLKKREVSPSQILFFQKQLIALLIKEAFTWELKSEKFQLLKILQLILMQSEIRQTQIQFVWQPHAQNIAMEIMIQLNNFLKLHYLSVSDFILMHVQEAISILSLKNWDSNKNMNAVLLFQE